MQQMINKTRTEVEIIYRTDISVFQILNRLHLVLLLGHQKLRFTYPYEDKCPLIASLAFL